ncbi:hypothetical protein K2X33_08165 [bacterium]|nr:hypothetical protein [bacterium]
MKLTGTSLRTGLLGLVLLSAPVWADEAHQDLPFEDPQEESDYQEWASAQLEGLGIGESEPEQETALEDALRGAPIEIPFVAKAPATPLLFEVAGAGFQAWKDTERTAPQAATREVASEPAPLSETEKLTESALQEEEAFRVQVREASLVSPTYRRILEAMSPKSK